MTTDLSQLSTIRERYRALDTDRSAALIRKREHAMLTMPSLLPPAGMASYQALDVPYNAISAEGAGFLASKIMSVVFPLNGQSVFEILLNEENIEGEPDRNMEEIFSKFEQRVMKALAPTNLRSEINLAYQHLIVIGDCLIFMDDDFSFRLFRVDQYVVRRKHEGEWMEIIIEEWINAEWYPDLASTAPVATTVGGSTQAMGSAEKWEPLYTQVKRQSNGTFLVIQEFRDTVVSEKSYKVSPYMPVRWSPLAGEPYGISLVENQFGDIRAVDSLSKSELDGAALNAEYRWGVNPAGLTELADLMNSVNGDFVPAAPDDVWPLQFQNHAQVQATHASVVHREQMIGRRFLMNSASQPQGERVTARQVSILAYELESQLGGVLSLAAKEIQEPIIRRALYLLSENNRTIPKEISDEISKQGGFAQLHIRAGLEILNREAEREKLDGAIDRMRNLPEAALAVFRWDNIARDWWRSMGLDADDRIKTAEELESERKVAEQRAMAQQAAAAGVQAGLQPQPGANQIV